MSNIERFFDKNISIKIWDENSLLIRKPFKTEIKILDLNVLRSFFAKF